MSTGNFVPLNRLAIHSDVSRVLLFHQYLQVIRLWKQQEEMTDAANFG